MLHRNPKAVLRKVSKHQLSFYFTPPGIQLIQRFIWVVHIPTFFLRWAGPFIVAVAVVKGWLYWCVTGAVFVPVVFDVICPFWFFLYRAASWRPAEFKKRVSATIVVKCCHHTPAMLSRRGEHSEVNGRVQSCCQRHVLFIRLFVVRIHLHRRSDAKLFDDGFQVAGEFVQAMGHPGVPMNPTFELPWWSGTAGVFLHARLHDREQIRWCEVWVHPKQLLDASTPNLVHLDPICLMGLIEPNPSHFVHGVESVLEYPHLLCR